MNIYDLMKILSSENKSKIIAHYWECNCVDHDCVGDLQRQLNINQSNLSKHIAKLLKFGVLEYKQINKQRYYYLNLKFKHEYFDVINPIVNSRENIKYKCCECSKKGE